MPANTPLQEWQTLKHPGVARDTYAHTLKETNLSLGAFLSFDDQALTRSWESASTPESAALAGLPFGVKDNIAVQGQPLSCGSRMLAGLTAPYTATAVERLITAGAVPIGKTNLDEFGMGSATENSALGGTANPWSSDHVPGGSSGGSAAAVAAGMVPFALGSDTGGSVRQPAGFCGVYGLKPTYGAVSRYGLVAYASSLEVIGALSADIGVLRQVFLAMSGQDERDQTTLSDTPTADSSPGTTSKTRTGAEKGKTRLAFIHDASGLHPDVAAVYARMREQARDAGFGVEEIDLSALDYAVPAYYAIATAEASANLARYNGVRYGHRPVFAESPLELMSTSRSEGFGDEVKLRVMLGTYVLRSGFQDQYYVRAQRIRTKLYRELEQLFSRVHGLVLPVFPTPPFRTGGAELDSFQQKQGDRFTTIANLSGSPACSFPAETVNGLPIGLQVMGPHRSEEQLLNIIAALQGDMVPARPPLFMSPTGTEAQS